MRKCTGWAYHQCRRPSLPPLSPPPLQCVQLESSLLCMAHLMGVPPRQAVRALRARRGDADGSDEEDVEGSGRGQAHLLDRQAHLEVLLKPAQELERDWEELLDILPGMRREELAALVAVTVRYRVGGRGGTGRSCWTCCPACDGRS